MLETVSKGFRSARNFLAGQAELTEGNTEEALREVRLSLLEADVELGVTKSFLQRVKEASLGHTVSVEGKDKKGQKVKLGPAEHFIKSCYDELVALMGPVDAAIRLSQPVGSIMMVGLQGTGKTTTTGKLAALLKRQKHRPLLVGADIYRPAAVDQLRQVAEKAEARFFHEEGVSPPELCKRALQKAREWQCDVVLFDTAGRLAINDELMGELEQIKALTKPDNVFLVVDAMTGQDAVRTAVEFDRRLDIDGFIMTKLDGDARGGAALSIKSITGKPIKFLGMGETMDKLEEFRPEGLASRILGMGDVVGLVKQFEDVVDKDKAEKDALRMMQGRFTLQDFLDQLKMVKSMGSISSVIEKIPGMGELTQGKQVDDREFTKLEAIVQSMTMDERRRPEVVAQQKSRKKRIAKGSGRNEKEVDDLLQRFGMMKQMMQMIGMQPSLLSRMPGFRNIGGLAKGLGGAGPADMSALFGGVNPFGAQGNRPLAPPKGYYATTSAGAAGMSKADRDKKAKRKAEKAARKKNRR
ncbi:MAG: signal recognition particle protein [Deltaproteobacteria bacterium]|nr:signal recognition particle protein [Deltaproteobacteria bacterium]